MSQPDLHSPRTLDVFLHIPKAAGTTLTRVLRTNAGSGARRTANVFKGEGGHDGNPSYERMVEQVAEDPDARLVTGHVPLGIDEFMPETWKVRYFTFLRDPVERAISHYYEIVEAEKERPRYAKDVEDAPLRSVADVTYDEALTHQDFVVDNLQTRMLSGQPRPFGTVDDAMLDQALANLERRLYVIGLAERFDESLVVLDRRLGYRVIPADAKRVNASRPRGDTVPRDLRQAAERANSADAVLYRRATELFEGYEELGEIDQQLDVEALRCARGASPADVATPDGFVGGREAWTLLLASRTEVIHARGELLRSRARNMELRAAVESLKGDVQEARDEIQALSAKLASTIEKLDRSRARNQERGLKARKDSK